MPNVRITLKDGTKKTVRFDEGFTDADVNEAAEQLNSQIAEPQAEEEKRGIDLTPSGLIEQGANAAASAILTPGEMIKEGQINPLEAYKNVYQQNAENIQRAREQSPVLSGVSRFGTDLVGYGTIPLLRGTTTPGRVGAFLGNAAIQGGGVGALESLKNEGDLSGFGRGTKTALGIQTALAGIPYVGARLANAVQNPNVQNAITKGLDVLTSVPQKFSQRALEAELSGNSILSGKFNPDTAYRPIEQKLTQAKGMLPNAADFGNEYYNLGQKALQGMENLKKKAGADIAAALEPLNNKEIQNGGLKSAVDNIINSFGEGGVYNSALEEAPQIVNYINGALSKKGLSLRDLDRIKHALYKKGYKADAALDGTTAEVARGVANQINNYLRRVSPSYAKPNDVYSVIEDVTRGLDHQTTMGSKLKNIGSTNSALSGLDQRLKAVDGLLPQPNKFYKQAEDLVNTENEVNNIINSIGKQYERNPKLLANRTDEAFEQALGDLQKRTGVNFMDELNNVRAREALEALTPGQGGGYGSAQGSANKIRGAITTALAGLGGVTGGLPGAIAAPLISTAMFSPKIMAKGTIQNIGKLSNLANKQIPEKIQKAISPLAIMLTSPTLYGGVEYNKY